MMHKVWSGIEEVHYFVSRSSINYEGHKNRRFGSDLSVFGWQLHLKFMNGYKLTHTASRSMEETLYNFLNTSFKFQGHTGRKVDHLALISAFPDDNCSLNSQMATKWYTWLPGSWNPYPILDSGARRGSLLFLEVICQISRSHEPKNQRFGSDLSMITRPVEDG